MRSLQWTVSIASVLALACSEVPPGTSIPHEDVSGGDEAAHHDVTSDSSDAAEPLDSPRPLDAPEASLPFDSAFDTAPDVAPDAPTARDAGPDLSRDVPGDVPVADALDAPRDVFDVPGIRADVSPDVPDDRPASGCGADLPVIRLPGDTVSGVFAPGTGLFSGSGCSSVGTEALYRLHVDARTGLYARAEMPGSRCSVMLSVRRVCADPLTDVVCNGDWSSGPTTSVRTELAPGGYTVVVDHGLCAGAPPYTLSVSAFTPAANAHCETARTLADGAVLAGEDLALATTRAWDCAASFGPSLFYRAVVPAGATLHAFLTGRGTFPPAGLTSALFGSCDSDAWCVAHAAADDPTVLRYTNMASAARTLVLDVGGRVIGTNGLFDLGVSIVSPAPHAVCAAARPLANGVPVLREDLLAGAAGAPACDGRVHGEELFYSATVPPRMTLTVTVTPHPVSSFMAPIITVMDVCGSRPCRATGIYGTTVQTATVRNETTSSQRLVIAVAAGAQALRFPAKFDLRIDLGPL